METFRIRDKRAKNRYYVDNELLRGGWGAVLRPYGIAAYDALALHANSETQEAWPSYQTIANLTGMSRRQAIREVGRLEEYRLIVVERVAGKPSTIILLDNSEWLPPTENHQSTSDRESPVLVTGSHPTSDRESPVLVTGSHPTSDRESPVLVTGSHPNNTNRTILKNNTKQTKPTNTDGSETDDKSLPARYEVIWDLTLRDLRGQLTRATYEAHLSHAHAVACENGTLYIGVPNHQTQAWLNTRLYSLVLRAVRTVDDAIDTVTFEVAQGPYEEETKGAHHERS